jgi:hypothetical protein
MFEPTTATTPQPPLPHPWGKYATWAVVIGLVLAFFAVPTFHNNVVQSWDVTRTFFARLAGFR